MHCEYPLDGACLWVWVQAGTAVNRDSLYVEDLGRGREGRLVVNDMDEILSVRMRKNVEIVRKWKKKKDKEFGRVRLWVGITEARELEERRLEKARKKEVVRERRWDGGREMVKIGKRVWKLVKGGRGKEGKGEDKVGHKVRVVSNS